MAFDDLTQSEDAQRRGYLLEHLMNQLFSIFDIRTRDSFRRNGQGEQIDGGFQVNGWYYLVECRWRKKPADIGDLDGLSGKVRRSGKQTMGLFFSMNGWSENVIPLLKQNDQKSLVLMHGYDLRAALEGYVDFREFLLAKLEHLNFRGEPHLDPQQYLTTKNR